jgi:small subunit ribosomal protein S11
MAKEVKKTIKIKSNKKFSRKKSIGMVSRGIVYIQATFNNTIVTITDENGNALSWATAGASGFTGTKKSTPFAAQIAVKKAFDKAKQYDLAEVSIKVAGVGSGRESAVRAVGGQGVKVTSIKDITPMPHNGARPKKVRRV